MQYACLFFKRRLFYFQNCPYVIIWSRHNPEFNFAWRSVLTSLNPVSESLLKSEDSGRIISLIITVKGAPTSQPGYDFYSRNFAPWVGVPEDPVTGKPLPLTLLLVESDTGTKSCPCPLTVPSMHNIIPTGSISHYINMSFLCNSI